MDFSHAVARFRGLQRRGRFPGGQIAVHHRGALVLEEVAGDGWTAADGAGRASRAVTADTPFCVWSASKPVVAMTVAVLEERGLLDVRAPIASLLPGFGAHGKERITTLDVLTHRSGLVVPELGQHWWDWDDWQKGLAKIFAATPRYARGTLVYGPYEFGWILAAVVEAVTGQRFADAFTELLARPAGLGPMSFWVGASEAGDVANTYLLAEKQVTVSGVRYDQDFARAANTSMLSSFVPGGSMITTARALSAFYAMLLAGGTTPAGVRVLRPGTVAEYTRRQSEGFDRMNRLPFVFGRGFLVGTLRPSLFGPWDTREVFGHGGALCALGFGDRRTGLAGAILTNGNWSIAEFALRFSMLVRTLRAAAA